MRLFASSNTRALKSSQLNSRLKNSGIDGIAVMRPLPLVAGRFVVARSICVMGSILHFFHQPAGGEGALSRPRVDQSQCLRQIARRIADSAQVSSGFLPCFVEGHIVQKQQVVPQTDFRQINCLITIWEAFYLRENILRSEQSRDMDIAAEEVIFH